MEDAVLELIELVLVGVDGGVPGEPGQCQTSFLTVDDLDDGGDFDDGRSGATFQLFSVLTLVYPAHTYVRRHNAFSVYISHLTD